MLRDKESPCQCSRVGFSPWVGMMPWRRKWQPTLEFLPGKAHEQRSMAGYSPWGQTQLNNKRSGRGRSGAYRGLSSPKADYSQVERPRRKSIKLEMSRIEAMIV